jgi:hypothetical protein
MPGSSSEHRHQPLLGVLLLDEILALGRPADGFG